MKRLGAFFLGCLVVLLLGPQVEAHPRNVGTYYGHHWSESHHWVSQPCPVGTHLSTYTFSKVGPRGLEYERIYRNCVPNAYPEHGRVYEQEYSYSDPGYSYQEREYTHHTPRPNYPARADVHQPPVIHQTPSYHRGGHVVSDTLVGGAFGAAAGAAIGAIVGDPADGAAIGAIVGGLSGLSRGTVGHGLLW